MAKEAPRRRLPSPPDVEDNLAQRLESGRQLGDDVVGQEFRHRGRASGVRARDFVRKMPSSKRSVSRFRRYSSFFGVMNSPMKNPLTRPLICAAMLTCGV